MIKKELRLSNFLLVFTWFSLLQTRSNGKICKNIAKKKQNKQNKSDKGCWKLRKLFNNRTLGQLAGMVTFIEWCRLAL